ncbi:hypothetical protein C7271_03320, partial [filamentous cyanobacterium CCP5]
LHTVLKHWLIPEKSRRWLGQTQPPHIQEVSDPTRSQPRFQPDWRIALEWLPRQPSHPADLDDQAPWLAVSQSWWQRLKFWNARWLQAGREVVGLNNLAVVEFIEDTVQQDCYWYAPWAPGKIVRSRFETSLSVPVAAQAKLQTQSSLTDRSVSLQE